MKLGKKLFLWTCVAALAFSHLYPSSAANAASATSSTKPSAKQQTIIWNWSDAGDRDSREFLEEDYWSVDELPIIELQITPTSPSRRVLLERFDETEQEWVVLAEERTARGGLAEFFVTPDCTEITGDGEGTWCDYSQTLRIRVLKALGQKQRISKSFEVSFQSAAEEGWDDENWDDSDE
jgi:hypothetical protein